MLTQSVDIDDNSITTDKYWIQFYKDTKVINNICTLKDGLYDGILQHFSKSGELTMELIFKDNVCISHPEHQALAEMMKNM